MGLDAKISELVWLARAVTQVPPSASRLDLHQIPDRARLFAALRHLDPSKPLELSDPQLRIHFVDVDALRILFREILVERCYDVAFENPAPTIVDVGANIGLATMYLKRQWQHARILAIEPSEPTFRALKRNILDNDLSDVRALNIAVGPQDERAVLYRDDAGGNLTMSLDPSRGGPVQQPVDVRRLSTLLPERTDLLKLDIEGGEEDVIAEIDRSGALPTIGRMIIEVHHLPQRPARLVDILDLLVSQGRDIRLAASLTHVANRWAMDTQDVLVYAGPAT